LFAAVGQGLCVASYAAALHSREIDSRSIVITQRFPALFNALLLTAVAWNVIHHIRSEWPFQQRFLATADFVVSCVERSC
jgi:hypothetical protein